MSRRFICPECDRTLSLPEGFRGRSARCPDCKSIVSVPSDRDDDERADTGYSERRRRRDSDEFDRREPERTRGLSTGAIVGIVLGCLVLLGGVAVVVALLMGRGTTPDLPPDGPVPGELPPIRTIPVANRCVWSVAFGQNGDVLLTGDGYFGPPGQVRLWKTSGEPIEVLLDARADVLGAALSPGDRFAGSASSAGVQLIDLGKRQVVATRTHPSYARTVTFSRNGQFLASSCETTVKVWNLPALDQRWSKPLTGELRMWRIATRLAFSADDRTLAVGNGNDLNVHDADTGNLAGRCTGHQGLVLCAAYSPDGKLLASGSMDGAIRLWNARDDSPLQTLPKLDDWVFCVCFSPDSKLLASACRNGTVTLWTAQGRPLATVQAHPREANCVCFAPDSKTLASSGVEGNVCLWDVSGFLGR
jgi:WD40 repeat protein